MPLTSPLLAGGGRRTGYLLPPFRTFLLFLETSFSILYFGRHTRYARNLASSKEDIDRIFAIPVCWLDIDILQEDFF